MTNLFDAFRATDYCVADGDLEFILRIGEPCDARVRPLGAAFITAANPQGRSTPAKVNAEANQRLRKDLWQAAQRVYMGFGRARDSDWREDSFLACGIPQNDAEALGRKYDQLAIVWIGESRIPELLVL